MKKIGILLPGKSEGHEKIAEAFKQSVVAMIPGVDIINLSDVEPGECLVDGFDLVVTVGTACTLFMESYLDERQLRLPLVCMGVHAPTIFQRDEKARYENLTGVAMRAPSPYLSLDTVFKLCGLSRRIVLIARADANGGAIRYTLEQMREYATKSGVCSVETVCFEDKEICVEHLSGIIQRDDIIIPISGGLLSGDVTLIEETCSLKGADFVSIANGFLPATAIYGYVGDIECLGIRAAGLSKKIVIDGVGAKQLPYVLLDDTTQIVVNAAVLDKQGVSLPKPGFVCSLDDSQQYQVIYQASYPFVLTTMTEYENRLAEHMAWLGKDRVPGIQCIPNTIQGLHNTPEHRAWVIKQAMDSRGGPIAVIGGERMAYLVQLEMIKQNKFRSLMIVRSSDDCPRERATVKRKGWPADCFIQRATIEVPSAAVFIDFLQYLQPTVKRIGCVYSYELELMPAHLKKRLAALKKECRKRGLQFLHAGRGVSNMEFEDKCRSLLRKTDLIMSMSDALRPSDGMFAALACHEESKLFVGSDLDRSDRSGAMLGPQYKMIAQKLIEIVSEVAMGRKPADTADLFFSAKEYYGWCVNDNWLRMHDLPAVPDTFLVPAYTRVPAIWNPEEPYGGVLRVAHLSVAHWQPPVAKKSPQLIALPTKEQAEAGFLALLDKQDPKLLE